MARRNKGLVELLADSPWPAGLVVGAIGFLVIRYGLGWFFSTFGGTLIGGVGTAFSNGALAPMAWVFLGMGALASLASAIRSRHRAATLDSNRSLQQIRDLSWIRFEQLVGEAFRRQGYSVEETGLGGADGGIDLRLRRDGQLHIVQCKQWRRERVGVSVVREMFGLLVHHGAHRVKIVTIGDFTPDALAFARDKPVDCITGAQLLQLIEGLPLQTTSTTPSNVTPTRAADCPTCGSTMTTRTNRRSGEHLMGCTRYPAVAARASSTPMRLPEIYAALPPRCRRTRLCGDFIQSAPPRDDDAQSIYGRGTRRKVSFASMGVQARGRTTILRLNHRNTYEIPAMAKAFAGDLLQGEEGDEDAPHLIAPESAGRHGATPTVIDCHSLQHEADVIASKIADLLANGHCPNQIAVIWRDYANAACIEKALRRKHVPLRTAASGQDKKALFLGEPSVKLVSMHSSKGLEFETVFVSGFGRQAKEGDDGSTEARLLYVAMTRDMASLAIIRISQGEHRIAL